MFWHCNKNSQDTEASDHICDDHCMCNCHHDHCDHSGPDDNAHDQRLDDHQSLGAKVLPSGQVGW